MVFYRKYRPQRIDDLDSTAVRESLVAVLKKEIPHAFLFTGPKGLGKTSTARIIAKVVNCEKRKKDSIEPCNECDQCVAITNGTSLDILEIDAASNRGIDEIRELKDKIRLAPVSAKKKIYIIDEVHMLTTEAFNALLKTLEEPPEHAMFMLCTTEPHKIPNTIHSRCFHITFSLATPEELVRSFKRIVKGENIKIADDALFMVANLSEGGFRDGAKLLEELITLAGDQQITNTFIEEKYRVSSISQYTQQMLTALLKRDTKTALIIVEALVEQGVDMKYFLQQLMEVLHASLLQQVGVKTEKSEDLGLTLKDISLLYSQLSQAVAEIKNAILPQLPLELAIIEWCESEEESGHSTQNGSNDINVKSTKVSVAVKDDTVTVDSMRKKIGHMKKQEALYGTSKASVKKVVSDDGKMEVSHATVELLKTSGDGPVTEEWLSLFWDCLINEMKRYNHTVAGVLRSCQIKSYANQKLIISTSYKFHKERIEDLKNFASLAKMCKLLTGKETEITVELKNKL